MKLILGIILATLSASAFAQLCEITMINRHERPIRTYHSYNDSCREALKECRRDTRLKPELGGVDCIQYQQAPTPPYPAPNPPYPTPTDILHSAKNFRLQNCYVAYKDGFNQLYIHGSFRGNYYPRSEDVKLAQIIYRQQINGVCLYKNNLELSYMDDPQLLNRAINGTLSRNCYIRPYVHNKYHQLYINGDFRGNYEVQSNFEMLKLKSILASRLASGECY